MSRFGKIARLPLDIREQLNRRLQDGEIGRELVVWLNSVPEVQAVLKAEFGDRPVNEPNLSDWRTGGYEDWRVQQETMQQVNQLVANAKELGGASNTPLSELLTTCLAARYAVELSRLTTARTPREGMRPTTEADGEGGCDLEVLRKLCRDVLALRRLDLAAQRLRIEREAADREMRADEEERKEKLLQAEQHRQMLQRARQSMRADGYHLPYDPTIDDEAEMQKEVAVEELRRERDKLAALHDKLVKQTQQVEEAELAEAAERSRRSARRKAAPKAGAKEPGKTGAAVAPGTTAQDGSGQSNKGELSKIKATKGKLRMPKAGAASKAVAKAVRDAKILMGTLKEGEWRTRNKQITVLECQRCLSTRRGGRSFAWRAKHVDGVRCCCGRGRPRSGARTSPSAAGRGGRQRRQVLADLLGHRCCGRGRPRSGLRTSPSAAGRAGRQRRQVPADLLRYRCCGRGRPQSGARTSPSAAGRSARRR
jgi:hypothetical protein